MRLAGNTGRKKSPSKHHRTTLSGSISATKACIDNWKKLLNSNMSSTCPHNMVKFVTPTAGFLGHPCKFQQVSRLGCVTVLHSSSGRQPYFAALIRGPHLYLAGRPSCWTLAHIVFSFYFAYFNLYKKNSLMLSLTEIRNLKAFSQLS